MAPSKGLDKYSDLREDESKKRQKNKEKWLKIFKIFLRIVRWPLLFIVMPFLTFYLSYLVSGSKEPFEEAINNDKVFVMMMLGIVIGTAGAGIIGAVINKSFLSTTGLAALVYIVGSFFVRNKIPEGEVEPSLGFENTKLIVVVLLILLVFIGDLITLVFRLLKEKSKETSRETSKDNKPVSKRK